MKLRAVTPIMAEDFETFASDVAEKMVGQTTGNGWVVTAAENDGPRTIWLTIEIDIEDAEQHHSLPHNKTNRGNNGS